MQAHAVPIVEPKFASVELFSGCGGLALGLARAGFNHRFLVEFNGCAVATVEHNRAAGLKFVEHWPIQKDDVRDVDWRPFAGVDLVAGGPPCQPFSIGGKAKGNGDSRDMWPEAVRAVREIGPAAFIFENVRGLKRPKFAMYLHSIEEALRSAAPGLGYKLSIQVVNAADYGAAQKRYRVIVLGVRDGLGCELPVLSPTHTRERLLWDQWVTGDYWREHGLSREVDAFDKIDASTVRRLRRLGVPPKGERWVTVRDRLKGLGDPDGHNNHVFQPGARVYPGHTGSRLDQPAKALKAGDHGVPGGENMMVRDDGSVRYFTLREAARLQGFPDDYRFPQSWTESMRQLGNAVPVELAALIGSRLQQMLASIRVSTAKAA